MVSQSVYTTQRGQGIRLNVPWPQPTTELRDQRYLVGGLRSLGRGGPWRGPEHHGPVPQPSPTSAWQGQEAGSGPRAGCLAAPRNPAPPWDCVSRGKFSRGQPAFSPMPVGPSAGGGVGGNNTAGGSSPRSGRCSGCAEATSCLAARVLTMCSLPFCPLCAWGLSSSYEATPTGVDPTPGLIPNSATAGAGLHHMNLAGWG